MSFTFDLTNRQAANPDDEITEKDELPDKPMRIPAPHKNTPLAAAPKIKYLRPASALRRS